MCRTRQHGVVVTLTFASGDLMAIKVERWLALFVSAALAACGSSQGVPVAAGAAGTQAQAGNPNPPTGGLLQGPGAFVVDSTEDATDRLPGDGRCATAAGKCS